MKAVVCTVRTVKKSAVGHILFGNSLSYWFNVLYVTMIVKITTEIRNDFASDYFMEKDVDAVTFLEVKITALGKEIRQENKNLN